MVYTTKTLDLRFALESSNISTASFDQPDVDCDEYDVDVDPVNADYYSRYCSII